MKNKKEYEASIFAKRDALLKKRKKNIKAAVSAICVILCIGAASFAVPELINKSYDEQAASTAQSTDALIYAEETAEISDELFDTIGLYGSAAEDNESDNSVNYFSDNQYFASGSATKKSADAAPPAENKNSINEITVQTEISLETEIYWENGNKPELSISTTAAATNNHAEKKIVEAAYGYLSNQQKAKVIDPDSKDITITRTADGNEYYTVYFHTENGGYKISVDSASLEMIGFDEFSKTVSQITPAYNPNE